MSLPVIKNASFSVRIKEFDKPVKVRPMIVSEHKSIQQAVDIGSADDAAMTIADVTAACTNNVVNAQNTQKYILDYFFLQLYMASVENVVNSKYKCYGIMKDEEGNNKVDEETGDVIKCGTTIDVAIDLGQATIVYPENYDKLVNVVVSDTVSIRLKCLSLESHIDINSNKDQIIAVVDKINAILLKEEPEDGDTELVKEYNTELAKLRDKIKETYVFSSIDYITDNDNMLKPGVDFNEAEFAEWLNKCPSSVAGSIEEFYDVTPDVGMNLHIRCAKCGNKHDAVLSGIQDFFS